MTRSRSRSWPFDLRSCGLIVALVLGPGLAAHPAAGYEPAEPVIGVLTYPIDSNLTGCNTGERSARNCRMMQAAAASSPAGGSYIEAAYVRWLESSGARVVPIPFDAPVTTLEVTFARVNGILLTGGPAKPLDAPPPYFANARRLYELVKRAWMERGETVPLWGTCLGLQTVACIAAGGEDVLGDFQLENVASPLDFTAAADGSRLFGGLTEAARGDFRQNVTTNWHHYGVSPGRLPSSLVALATNRAEDGREFVSALEGRSGLPVFAVQFHPESVQWMPQSEGVPSKTAAAVRTAQLLGDFLVDAARANRHAYTSALDEALALVSQAGTLLITPPNSTTGDAMLYQEDMYVFLPSSTHSYHNASAPITTLHLQVATSFASILLLINIGLLMMGIALPQLLQVISVPKENREVQV